MSESNTPRTDKYIIDEPENIYFINADEDGNDYERALFNVVDFARQLERELSESNAKLAKAVELLKVAKCPNCDGCGFTVRETGGCGPDGEGDNRECVQEQCEWCFYQTTFVREFDDAKQEEIK